MPDTNAPPLGTLDALQRRRHGLQFGLLALAAFGAVFATVKLKRSAALDRAITLRIQRLRWPALGRLMWAVSWPGFPPQSRIIPPGIVAFLWLRRYRREAAFQAAAWGTAVLSTLV